MLAVKGHKMTDSAALKRWPKKKWMAASKKPKLHQWLEHKRSRESKDRLHMIGNIVVPEMAYFATQCLASMWQ